MLSRREAQRRAGETCDTPAAFETVKDYVLREAAACIITSHDWRPAWDTFKRIARQLHVPVVK